MKEPHWERIQEIYHEARRQPRVEQRAFVERESEGNPVLAGKVMELLAHDDSSFLEPPICLHLASSEDELVGATIGSRYFIEKELGGGGMSEVYLARDLKVSRKAVVVKILSLELLEHPYARQKFEQEVEALSRIHHDGVVQVFDKGELPDGRPYFVMEFIHGESLRSQIPSKGMNLKRAASILKQIGSSLEHVHGNKVFHRDLKPENIMLKGGTDSVVLIDFGIAKVTDSVVAPGTTTGESAGTLMYMSPEQLCSKEITAASDIYSMAVLAYEMVTGQRPFNSISREELLKQQADVDINLLRNVPPKAQQILLRGLSYDPAARSQNARRFGEDLAKTLQRDLWPRAAIIVLGMALVSFLIYQVTIQPPPKPNRSFDYFLTVQRTRDRQPYQVPYKSHGEEMFGSGDNFRLTVTTPVDAFIYVFHDGSLKENGTSFRMIFPRKAANDGSASLGADKSIESEWMTFEGPPGVENFWIVWSPAPVAELESIKKEALDNAGRLTGDTLVRVKQYLTTKEAEIDATTVNYNASQTAVVRARHDLLVALAQFKHR
jgi:serine/threonine protein kinase